MDNQKVEPPHHQLQSVPDSPPSDNVDPIVVDLAERRARQFSTEPLTAYECVELRRMLRAFREMEADMQAIKSGCPQARRLLAD